MEQKYMHNILMTIRHWVCQFFDIKQCQCVFKSKPKRKKK